MTDTRSTAILWLVARRAHQRAQLLPVDDFRLEQTLRNRIEHLALAAQQ